MIGQYLLNRNKIGNIHILQNILQINKTVEIKHIRVEVEICRLMELHLFVSHVIWHVKTPNGQQSEGDFSRVS